MRESIKAGNRSLTRSMQVTHVRRMAAVGAAWLAVASVAGVRADEVPVTVDEAGTAGPGGADPRSVPGEQTVSSTAGNAAVSAALEDAGSPQEVPGCVPAAGNDPAPWKWHSRILDSFPPDVPRPVWVGSFADADHRYYQLDLWRDSKGVFGEFRNPVLEADSPTSRLYDVKFDPATGALEFRVRVPVEDTWFSGTLRRDSVAGILRYRDHAEMVEWRRRPDVNQGSGSNDTWSSRAQFECAMTLWHRY